MTDESSHKGSGRDGRGTSAAQDVEASDDATHVVSSAAAGAGAKDPQVRDGSIPPGTILIHTYRVEELLARGGMGEIYRATHTELNTEHAIKVIRPELAEQPKIVDMFRREASSLRNVRNEAVIAYDGVFRDEVGQLYLVMEFVHGRLLSEVLCERHLSIEELRTLCDRVATGLGAAHEKGIVHRDMSPDNVILPDGQVENAKVIDFGIAKLTDPAEATILGDDFAGKYSYASPEQLGLFGGQVDARSDIYSLGLVLVAAAIGHPLPMGSTPSAVIEARRSVPDLSEVPQELRAELGAMLEPNPDDRPQSLKELGLRVASEAARPDVAGHISPSTGEEVRPGTHLAEAASPGTGAKAPGKRRSRAKAALTLIVALAVIGGAIGGYLVLTEPGGDRGDSDQTAERDTPEGLGTLTPRQDDERTRPEPSKAGGQTPAVLAKPSNTAGTSIAENGTSMTSTEDDSTASVGTKGGTTSNGSLPKIPTDVVQLTGPAATELGALRAQVGRFLEEFACADMASSISDGGFVEVTGFLSTAADLDRLTRGLEAIPNAQGSRADVAIQEWPFCAAIKTLKEFTSLAPAGAPEIAPNKSARIYRNGEVFAVTVTGSDRYDGYLYVAYMNSRGDVAHLLPSPLALDNTVRAGKALSLGNEGYFVIGEPYGRDMIIAISTPVRLFETVPPQIQSAQEYFDLMRRALSKVQHTNGTSATSRYVFITTTP